MAFFVSGLASVAGITLSVNTLCCGAISSHGAAVAEVGALDAGLCALCIGILRVALVGVALSGTIGTAHSTVCSTCFALVVVILCVAGFAEVAVTLSGTCTGTLGAERRALLAQFGRAHPVASLTVITLAHASSATAHTVAATRSTSSVVSIFCKACVATSVGTHGAAQVSVIGTLGAFCRAGFTAEVGSTGVLGIARGARTPRAFGDGGDAIVCAGVAVVWTDDTKLISVIHVVAGFATETGLCVVVSNRTLGTTV